MANFEEYPPHLQKDDDMYDILRDELKKKGFVASNKYYMPIDALKVVDTSVEGQWKERLIQAKSSSNGKHIILIPCLVEQTHWIGVIIKFRSTTDIEFAEFLDPVIESDYYPTSLQKTFDRIYSNSILRAGQCEKHRDQNQSMKLTIKNLLSAAERSGTKFAFMIFFQ